MWTRDTKLGEKWGTEILKPRDSGSLVPDHTNNKNRRLSRLDHKVTWPNGEDRKPACLLSAANSARLPDPSTAWNEEDAVPQCRRTALSHTQLVTAHRDRRRSPAQGGPKGNRGYLRSAFGNMLKDAVPHRAFPRSYCRHTSHHSGCFATSTHQVWGLLSNRLPHTSRPPCSGSG